MGELTDAQAQAVKSWRLCKPRPYERKWEWDGCAFAEYTPLFRRMTLANMRNAWVAYHAGADWMAAGAEEMDVPFGFSSAQEWQASELARLTAEVERLRAHAEHDRETLTPIENAFEAVGGDLVDEALWLRSEVERLRSGIRGAAHRLRRGIDACGLDDNARNAEVFCAADMLDALAREDGAG